MSEFFDDESNGNEERKQGRSERALRIFLRNTAKT